MHLLLSLLLIARPSLPECDNFEDAVLFVCAAADISEVDPDEVDRLRSYMLHPLKINRMGRRELTSCGLFSPYQVATLLDYRSRNGVILSPTELGIIDGFTPLAASCIAIFLDFSPDVGVRRQSQDAGSIADMIWVTGDVQAGVGGKIASGQPGMQYQGRANAEIGIGAVEAGANIAVRTPWAMPGARPQDIGWNLRATWEGLTITGGCFNARFGQGLTLWTGTVFDSFTTPDALMRKPTGIRPYNAYTPANSMQGIAATYSCSIGKRADALDITAFADLGDGSSGRSFGGNIGWLHPHGSLGLSTIIPAGDPRATRLSVDFQHTIRGIVLYGEVASSPGVGSAGAILSSFSGIIGTQTSLGPCQLAARLAFRGTAVATVAIHYLSDNRHHHISLGSEYLHSKRQTKAVLNHNWLISPSWSLTSRANIRVRRDAPRLRADLRSDAGWAHGPWTIQARVNILYCKSLAALTFIQAGYHTQKTEQAKETVSPPSHNTRPRISAILQGGLFRIDNWDDRIYVYRHDVPGSFSVPAMYGRGYWLAGYCSIRPIRHLRLCFRCDYTGYFTPFTASGAERKPSLNARILLIADF